MAVANAGAAQRAGPLICLPHLLPGGEKSGWGGRLPNA